MVRVVVVVLILTGEKKKRREEGLSQGEAEIESADGS